MSHTDPEILALRALGETAGTDRDDEHAETCARCRAERVDLGALHCPLFLLGGATDHITPPVQVFRAADAVSTPTDRIWKRTAPGGHLGLFMGNQALREEWPPIMTEVARFSGVAVENAA